MAARARAVAAMSSSSSILLAAAVALALLVSSASAQSGCTAALVGLYPCMNYISGNDTAPTKSCCSQLGSVVQSQPQCLCSALGGDSSSLGGMTINKTRALELPNACSVQTPPASKCNGAGGGSAPGAGSGSKTTPTAYLQGSGGSSLHGTARLVLALSAAAIFVVSTV
ncbi:non-specific lipid transfer protein GPI-anchored 5 [Aegilops tauschii subsp. strangulata]|uniref:Bifunctional inhibitor/plant lipid transfer protein/seed storage helical domain-containing protein n=2 Tax=Aegilops tauschii TaxID=37682 RepID=A0A453M1L8_AEGTS|nr:non-specific lipid transfer protein GPI-anchored 5 [Aegilops tauschii subsp. strangulata]